MMRIYSGRKPGAKIPDKPLPRDTGRHTLALSSASKDHGRCMTVLAHTSKRYGVIWQGQRASPRGPPGSADIAHLGGNTLG